MSFAVGDTVYLPTLHEEAVILEYIALAGAWRVKTTLSGIFTYAVSENMRLVNPVEFKLKSSCECGSHKLGHPRHSHWCPLDSTNRQ